MLKQAGNMEFNNNNNNNSNNSSLSLSSSSSMMVTSPPSTSSSCKASSSSTSNSNSNSFKKEAGKAASNSNSPPTTASTSPFSCVASQKKIYNTGALLDQYQDDDDLTTNLLHAIRSWNLERPTTDTYGDTDGDGDGDGDTIGNGGALFHSAHTPISSNHYQQQQRHQRHQHQSHDSTHELLTTSTPPNNTPPHQYQHRHDCNSTIDTNASGTTLMSSSSNTTMRTNESITTTNSTISASVSVSATKKQRSQHTPKGNYSSRPSGLTARILLLEQNDNNKNGDVRDDDNHNNHNNNKKDDNDNDDPQDHSSMDHNDVVVNNDTATKPPPTGTTTAITTSLSSAPSSSSSSSSSTATMPSSSSSSNNEKVSSMSMPMPMSVINDIAQTLGLDPKNKPTDYQKIIPTIQKLVRVVMVHVPNLEQFVDDVCTIVEHDNDNDNDEKKEEEINEREKQQARRKPKKNLEARKKKMDDTVEVLKSKFYKRQRQQCHKINNKDSSSGSGSGSDKKNVDSSIIPTITTTATSSLYATPNKGGRKALQKVNVNSILTRDVSINTDKTYHQQQLLLHHNEHSSAAAITMNKANTSNKSFHEELYSFRHAIMERLIKCDHIGYHHHYHHHCVDAINATSGTLSRQSSSSSSQNDNEKALQTIDELINFQQKYMKVNGINTTMSSSSIVSSSTSHEEIMSPPHSSTILNDLFNADTSTLRQIVLHFAYLFEVRHDEIMMKMNDIYVFSHEATIMVSNMKEILGLSPNCPIHLVAKEITEKITRYNGEKEEQSLHCRRVEGVPPLKQSQLSNQEQGHDQQQHVRFHDLVEEFIS